ncbi:MAG: MerR family transcriptional regulator [Bacilli bacterium]|nr:MerR family transcriptional regulator [Bacilli bacterium]
MTIKEVSEMFNVSADTLRYYEKIGLIENVERTKAGIRNYQEKDLKRIQFIKCMRSAGLSIERLKRYVDLFHEGEDSIIERKEILISQKEELVLKIKELEETLNYLDFKIKNYDSILADKKEVSIK